MFWTSLTTLLEYSTSYMEWYLVIDRVIGWSLEIRTALQSDFSSMLRCIGVWLWYNSELHSNRYGLTKHHDDHLKWTKDITRERSQDCKVGKSSRVLRRDRGKPNFRGWDLLHMPTLGSNSRRSCFLCWTYRWCMHVMSKEQIQAENEVYEESHDPARHF